jgi:cytoskeletal protein CcmA (bactofilin family)
MFASKRISTVIAEGLRIIGNVSADGAVQVNGQIDGDLNCTSITVSPKALINGGVKARSVVVNGKVEGPIVGQEVVLKSQAFVTGDIQAQTLLIERGAHFEGRSLRELLGL